MYQDPIIKEIRDIRHEIEKNCNNDSQEYYEYLRKIQKQYAERLVCRKPKPALKLANQ